MYIYMNTYVYIYLYSPIIIQKFSKVRSLLDVLCKITIELIFENSQLSPRY